MQKLFLTGNGFDLAHGLKTRYLDFMNWMYEKDNAIFISFNKLLLKNFLMKMYVCRKMIGDTLGR